MANVRARLVLLPGLDGTGRFFDLLAKRLAGVVPIEVETYPENDTNTYDDHVRRIAVKFGRERFVALGESFGGPIAVKWAALNPASAIGVILAATFLSSPWPPWLLRVIGNLSTAHAPNAALSYFLLGERRDQELRKQLFSVLRSMPKSVSARRIGEVARVDVNAEFRALRCPALVLHGTKDRLVSSAPIACAACAKDGAEVRLFTAPHMLLQTKTDECAEEIENFIWRIEMGR